MNAHTLLRLVIAAVLLIVLWIGIGIFSREGTDAPLVSEAWTEVMSTLRSGPDAVERLRIEDPEDALRTLERDPDGSWTVNGFLADSAVIDRFWSTAADVELGALAASNPSNHPRMGVAADSSITAAFTTTSATQVTVLVGNQGPGVGTAYARVPSEDEVYTLTGGIRAFLARSEWDWRDKRLTTVDTGRVAQLHVETPDYQYALVRSDTAWTMDGRTVQRSPVVGILEELGNLVASGAIEPDDPLAQAPINTTITALGAGGDTLATAALGEGSGDRAGRAPNNATIYRIPGFRAQRLTPAPEALIPPSP